MKLRLCTGLLLLAIGFGYAGEIFPKKTWKDAPDPLASPDAEIGGELVYYSGQKPKGLNYYLTQASDTAIFFGLMYETLLTNHPITLEHQPGLADRWTISDDKKVFTFHLDPAARWSDGKPITAADVKFTFDTIMQKKNLTGSWKTMMERFAKVEVVDAATIRFTGKKVHWALLDNAGGLYVLPRHAMAGKDFMKLRTEFPVVSGPYAIDEFKDGRYLRLKRRRNWWASKYKRNRNKHNFVTLKFKFYESGDTAFDAFLKGEFDICPIHKAAIWVKKTNSDRFLKNWIVKQEIHNYNPSGFQGWAMNMRQPPFDDVRVRLAMYHLLDRRKMNKTLMHGLYFMHRSFYEDLYNKENPCKNKLIEYDKKAARKLLADAGWTVNPKTGLLEKDGNVFEINFLTRGEDTNRFLDIYDDALKDIGIKLTITQKDWSAWLKDMDSFNFQMTWAAWGASVKKDPEDMWYSKEANRKASSNITGFQSDKVDALIEQQREIFDIRKRHAIVRRIDHIVYSEFPYLLLWNLDFVRLCYWNRFGTPPTVLSKYGDAETAITYWWSDEDAVGDLEEAQEGNRPLPKRRYKIDFDKEFR